MMQVIAALAGLVRHREAARDNLARGRTHRSQERLSRVVAVIEYREGFAIYFDGDFLGVTGSGNQAGDQQDPHG